MVCDEGEEGEKDELLMIIMESRERQRENWITKIVNSCPTWIKLSIKEIAIPEI